MTSHSSLRATFERMAQAQQEGIPGVVCIQAAQRGPVVGITVCTHGNEPSGLAAIAHLLDVIGIKERLARGTLYLVLNNLEATEAFFKATTKEEIRRTRYRDINMNRLPSDMLEIERPTSYEVMRAQELFPVWKRFQVALDIHSTIEKSNPMIISRGDMFYGDLIRGFPIRTLISHIDAVQIGKPAFSFYGKAEAEARALAIETGQHTENASFERARSCALAFLTNLKMLQETGEPIAHEYDEYYVEQSIVFPNISYDFVKEFSSFEPVTLGELLAVSSTGEEIHAPYDGHILMPTIYRGENKDISEEVGFLARPVRSRQF